MKRLKNSASQVDKWRQRTQAEIAAYGCQYFFDSPVPSSRRRMTLEEVMEWPIVDEATGLENNIYNERGARIPRQVALRRESSPRYAGLLDVKNMKELFMPDLEEEACADQGYTGLTSKYYAYPQAGLLRYGHFQASGMMNPIKPFIKEINKRLVVEHGDRDDEDDNNSMNHPDMSPHPPVTGVATQGYNSAMHYARGRGVQYHDAQLGLVTAALAGTYALTAKEKRIASEKQQACKHRLPHEQFNHKINEPAITRELRMENVYCVDMLAIKLEYRTGG